MAFWENIGKKASETTAKAMQKAMDFTEITKLNSAVEEEEKILNKCYCQIGRIYASKHPKGVNSEKELADLVVCAEESCSKIERYRQMIQNVKGIRKCENCGAEVPLGTFFCSSCGKVLSPEFNSPENGQVCKTCGAVLRAETKFCTSCGAPVIQMGNQESAEEISIGLTDAQEKKCQNCGAVNGSDAAFCLECGAKI